MDTDTFYERLEELTSRIDIEAAIVDSTLEITHYQVPESERGQGIGTDVIQSVIALSAEYGLSKIRIHIDWTGRGADGVFTGSVEQDPTIKFLHKNDFQILNAGRTSTVEAIYIIDE